jgi:hypothetical protein
LPAKLKRIGIDRFRIYGQVANLFTITKYSGPDPELPGISVNFEVDGRSYPANQKVFTVGVSLSF